MSNDAKQWSKFVSEEQMRELNKFPHLKEAIERTFITVDYDVTKLSPMTVWFRLMEDIKGADVIAFVDWDEETLDEFYSWGSNSRWANVFEPDMMDNAGVRIEDAISLAQEYGDIPNSVMDELKED